MAFQQLYYTSCETGLAGFGGYQFNAVTPGTSPAVMREVEGSSIYEPPRWLLADPCPDEPEAYPTAFSYAKSETTKAVILTHVQFAGHDYSGRPGNYFAHALVTSSPERDLAPLLPVELWGAALWKRAAIEDNTLPELPGPPARGVVDRDGVERFLEARGTERILPELLTAAWRAMAGDRLVLLSGHDPDENIWWIAALCYLSGERLSPELTFTTYSHRPGYSRHHLIGIQAESVPPDAEAGFRLFDLDEGKTPGDAPHPLAVLLADAGVTGSERLWRQATAFATGAEAGPDDWHGPIAAATGLLRGRLSADETRAVADWLSGAASRIPPQHAGIALGVLLQGPPAALTDEQVESLLDASRRIGSTAHGEQLERLLVERMTSHIEYGEPTRTPRLGPVGAEAARAAVTGLLGTASPEVALSALSWAAAYQAVPAETTLAEYGRTRLPAHGAQPAAARLLRGYPAIRWGFVGWLAGEPPPSASQVLASLGGEVIGERDVAAYPALAEELQLTLADDRRISPQHAFDRVRDIRREAQLPPYADAALLSRLWPGGCPPAEVAELLDVLADPPAADVRDWFVSQIEAAARQSVNSPGWQALTDAFAGNPALLQQLPQELAEAMERKVSAAQTWRRGIERVRGGDLGALADLYAELTEMPTGQERAFSVAELADMLPEIGPLSRVLPGCPADVLQRFLRTADQRLTAKYHDYRLAQQVFVALYAQDLPRFAHDSLWSSFQQVADWKRTDRNSLVKGLEWNYPRESEAYKDWLSSRSKPLIPKPQFPKKLFGGDPRGPAEDR